MLTMLFSSLTRASSKNESAGKAASRDRIDFRSLCLTYRETMRALMLSPQYFELAPVERHQLIRNIREKRNL